MPIRIAKIAEVAHKLDEQGFYVEADALTAIMLRVAEGVFNEADEIDESPDEVKPYKLNFIHPGRELTPEDPWYHQLGDQDPGQYRVIDPRDRGYQSDIEKAYRDRPYGDPSRPNAHEWLRKQVLPAYYAGGDVNGELLPHSKLPKPQFYGNYIIPVAPGQGHLTHNDRARFVAHDEDLANHEKNVDDVFNRATRFDPITGKSKSSAVFDVTSFGSEGKPVKPTRVIHDRMLDEAGAYDALKQRGSLPVSRGDQYDAVRMMNPDTLEPRARKAWDAIDWTNPDPELVQSILTHTSRGYGKPGIVNIERKMRGDDGKPNSYMNRKLWRSYLQK